MKDPQIRVRYAPSPTGLQHLGNLRSALFSWLYAQQQQGTFSLHFEDTDRNRLVEEAESYIEESLNWLGLEWDEGVDKAGEYGPYRQSERLNIYKEHAEQLLAEGRMYRDWTTSERLDELRRQAQAEKRPFLVRTDLLDTEGDTNRPHVLRFRIDQSLDVTWHDIVFGDLHYESKDIDDFVAIKSDGFPTYNFANVIDDHLMKISHVLRGNEYISSTPKYLQIYAAFGWTPPRTAHLPQVLGTDKAKLSKRHGAQPALGYRTAGYLPEAIINFLATLGWNDGTTQEIYSVDELITKFSLERIQKSPAVFDPERLNWMNGMHIRALPLDNLYAKINPDFWPTDATNFDEKYKKQVLKLVQERLKFFAELQELTDFFFTEPIINKKLLLEKLEAATAQQYLDAVSKIIEQSEFSETELETKLRQSVAELNAKTGDVFKLIRLSLTGKTVAPGLFETMVVLGKAQVNTRLKNALELIS